jgi:AraC-like DNA-binding protein
MNDSSLFAESGSPDYSVVRFSTADYAPGERLDAWREVYGRTLQKLDVEPLSDEEFHTEATLRRMPGLAVNVVRRSAVIHNRRREFVSHDDVGMTIGLTSSFEASQFGRTLTLGCGDAVVLTGAEPAALRALTYGEYIHLRAPVKALTPLVSDLDAAYGGRIPAGNTALGLLTRYVGILDETETLADSDLRRQAVTHVHDLMALAIGIARDAEEIAESRGVRAAILRAIKQDIAGHLDRADLSVATVAARNGVGPRYVQRLFEAEGTTFTEYVLEERLARAYRLLSDPRQVARKICAVAFDVGFGDLSYFNRTFRRRFGSPPSDIRAAARRDG